MSKNQRNKQIEHEEYAKIGARLRASRLDIGMSQEETADYLGMTFQQIQKYEKGTNRIPIYAALKLASRFGVEPSWLFGYEEGDKGEKEKTALMTKRGGIELIRLSSALNDNQISAMIVIAKQFNSMNEGTKK